MSVKKISCSHVSFSLKYRIIIPKKISPIRFNFYRTLVKREKINTETQKFHVFWNLQRFKPQPSKPIGVVLSLVTCQHASLN